MAQQISAAVQPPFDSGERKRKKVGDPGNGPLFEVAQLQHGLELSRKLQKMRPQFPLGAAPQYRLLRAGREGRAMAQNQGIQLVVFGRLLARLLPPHPPGAMPGDGADPCAEPLRLLQLRQRLERQQKRLLRQILGCLAGAERLVRDDDDGVPITDHQLIERFDVAQERVQNQLRIADVRVAAPLLCHSLHSSCKEETVSSEKDRAARKKRGKGEEDATDRSGNLCVRSALGLSRCGRG